MKPLNLRGDIWIEGFDDEEDLAVYWYNHMLWDNYRGLAKYELIYSGKTSEIPEELAKECVKSVWFETDVIGGCYMVYQDYGEDDCWLDEATESIQSACPEEYCIIYKK